MTTYSFQPFLYRVFGTLGMIDLGALVDRAYVARSRKRSWQFNAGLFDVATTSCFQDILDGVSQCSVPSVCTYIGDHGLHRRLFAVPRR